jgi:hypothetical protein
MMNAQRTFATYVPRSSPAPVHQRTQATQHPQPTQHAPLTHASNASSSTADRAQSPITAVSQTTASSTAQPYNAASDFMAAADNHALALTDQASAHTQHRHLEQILLAAEREHHSNFPGIRSADSFSTGGHFNYREPFLASIHKIQEARDNAAAAIEHLQQCSKTARDSQADLLNEQDLWDIHNTPDTSNPEPQHILDHPNATTNIVTIITERAKTITTTTTIKREIIPQPPQIVHANDLTFTGYLPPPSVYHRHLNRPHVHQSAAPQTNPSPHYPPAARIRTDRTTARVRNERPTAPDNEPPTTFTDISTWIYEHEEPSSATTSTYIYPPATITLLRPHINGIKQEPLEVIATHYAELPRTRRPRIRTISLADALRRLPLIQLAERSPSSLPHHQAQHLDASDDPRITDIIHRRKPLG